MLCFSLKFSILGVAKNNENKHENDKECLKNG